MKRILFISNNSLGTGLSGGDRIFVELIRGWSKRDTVTLLGSEEARHMAESRGVTGFNAVVSDRRNESPYQETIPGIFCHLVRRLRRGMAAIRGNPPAVAEADVVYSASDAYPDLFPAFSIKRKRPDVLWIAGYYLFIPPPFSAETPYKGRHWLRGCLYWLMQIPTYRIVRKHADVVFVTSEPDVDRFVTPKRDRSRVIVVRGGVDVTPSEDYLASGRAVPVKDRTYDACFVGRLHFQKGILELLDIWKQVVAARPNARLAVIGGGPLLDEVKDKMVRLGLDKNVDLLGFLDGEPKFAVFKQSRMMVHPATYDSGGMAAAEGMAWGLPAVSFDLEALKTYYPKGMLKTNPGDIGGFARNILSLLTDDALYARTSAEARRLILDAWNWSHRAEQLHAAVFGAD